MSEPDEPGAEIDLIFKEDYKLDRITVQEVELLGSLYPELVAEFLQMKEEE